eukprot:3564122-Prymnesium_polylepis.1
MIQVAVVWGTLKDDSSERASRERAAARWLREGSGQTLRCAGTAGCMNGSFNIRTRHGGCGQVGH